MLAIALFCVLADAGPYDELLDDLLADAGPVALELLLDVLLADAGPYDVLLDLFFKLGSDAGPYAIIILLSQVRM